MPPGLATGTVAQSIGVDTVDQNDTGRTAKEEYGKAITGPGVTTQERLLEEVVALCGVLTRMSPEASRARYGNRGPEELRRIIRVMKGKVEKRKAEKRKAGLQGKEEEAKPANHKNVRLFGVRRAEAQRNEDEDYEGNHSFGQSAGSSVVGQGVRGSLEGTSAAGKLFKNDGGEDFETRKRRDFRRRRGYVHQQERRRKFPQRQGFRECWRRFRVGLGRRPHRPGRRRWAHRGQHCVPGLEFQSGGLCIQAWLGPGRVGETPGHDGPCGVGCGRARHQRQGAQPKRIRIQDGDGGGAWEKCCWDNEEQWVDDDWTEDKVGGQCTEETVMGKDGEQETEVTDEGEPGDQFAGGLVNMRTARAGIGQRSAGMITPSDGAWTWRGATKVGRPIATTRGITMAIR